MGISATLFSRQKGQKEKLHFVTSITEAVQKHDSQKRKADAVFFQH